MIRRLLVVLALAVFAAGEASAASIGEALVARGYRFALYVAAEDSTPGSVPCRWGRCILGQANPAAPYDGSAASILARWGVPLELTAGGTVGERLPDSSELGCVVEKLGLPVGYVVTETDRADLKLLAIGAQGTAWDLEFWNCVPTPAPGTCQPPAECMVRPAPCETCPPPCEVCPPIPTPCAEKSAFILQTIEKSKAWDMPTRGRLRALKAVAAWAERCPVGVVR